MHTSSVGHIHSVLVVYTPAVGHINSVQCWSYTLTGTKETLASRSAQKRFPVLEPLLACTVPEVFLPYTNQLFSKNIIVADL